MFNDTGSITLGYSFDNKNGIPTVDTDLIHLSSANVMKDIINNKNILYFRIEVIQPLHIMSLHQQ